MWDVTNVIQTINIIPHLNTYQSDVGQCLHYSLNYNFIFFLCSYKDSCVLIFKVRIIQILSSHQYKRELCIRYINCTSRSISPRPIINLCFSQVKVIACGIADFTIKKKVSLKLNRKWLV